MSGFVFGRLNQRDELHELKSSRLRNTSRHPLGRHVIRVEWRVRNSISCLDVPKYCEPTYTGNVLSVLLDFIYLELHLAIKICHPLRMASTSTSSAFEVLFGKELNRFYCLTAVKDRYS